MEPDSIAPVPAGLAEWSAPLVDIENMLGRMAVILESELSAFETERSGREGDARRFDGKAAVDFVALVTKAVEKVDQMIKALRVERAAELQAQRGEPDVHEREELAERIAGRLNELAEARARALAAGFDADLGMPGS